MNSILACQSWRDLQGLPCVSYLSPEPDGARSSPVRETLGFKGAHARDTEQRRKPRSWHQPLPTLTALMRERLSVPQTKDPQVHITHKPEGRKRQTVKPEDFTQHPPAPSKKECFPTNRTRYFTPAVCVGAFANQIKITRRHMENSRSRTPSHPK